jgi:hypothetical protein
MELASKALLARQAAIQGMVGAPGTTVLGTVAVKDKLVGSGNEG